MVTIDRRALLGLLGGSGAAIASGLPFQAFAWDRPPPYNVEANPKFSTMPFTLGVASGDPAPDGFVIWTRLAPEPLDPHGGMPRRQMYVNWEVAADEHFGRIVQSGQSMAMPELAHAVHVEVAGLEPNRPYWYRFTVGGEQSPVGRSRTLPALGSRLDRVRFVAAGCQYYELGYFTAWRRISEEPVDFVFHYGDYIYEGAGAKFSNGDNFGRNPPPLRNHVGNELYSIDDYRMRYSQYKTDPDLQAAHAACPWFVSFDDHEIDNNWAGNIDENESPPEIFALRKAMALQAYYENMPLRRASLPVGGHMQMFRSAQYGDLLNAFVLDTRQYRSNQAYFDLTSPQGPDVFAPDRSIMGDRQEAWLFDGLSRSQTRWNLIAQQVLLMNLQYQREEGAQRVSGMDTWTGYMHSRRRLLDHIDKHRPGNVVTVSGDAHLHFAGDLIQDNGDGRVISAEFSATSITSGADGTGDENPRVRGAMAGNPELKAITDKRGYLLCDVNRDTWRADLKILDKVTEANGKLLTYASFVVEHGHPGIKRA
ncbi:alkaline phosphatase D family protein [Novosphingobium album (ex Liu et al. 2023)]|uniref:Alkaline phosphatase D family protein n=1 Tax=Novosphingobium album (ex Liu et al. 2023) TaxID=3031130 RepID=A0ABT5WLK2_9SPHN|nr:alkaline phosphatase D family protein [Novosphingobium album (ex Liu et al. 2023)]MDE8650187.1 alkaline phosphatase D family protein [Novosphingobium album (ex Liu et al. 2023)]